MCALFSSAAAQLAGDSTSQPARAPRDRAVHLLPVQLPEKGGRGGEGWGRGRGCQGLGNDSELLYSRLRGRLGQSLGAAAREPAPGFARFSAELSSKRRQQGPLRNCPVPPPHGLSAEPASPQGLQPCTTDRPQLWGSPLQCGGGGDTGQTVPDSQTAGTS